MCITHGGSVEHGGGVRGVRGVRGQRRQQRRRAARQPRRAPRERDTTLWTQRY